MRLLSLLLIACCCLCGEKSNAEERSSLADRIGVIDLDKVSARLIESEKSITLMREKAKKMSAEMSSKTTKADDLAQEITRSEGVLSRDEQDKKRKELNRLRNELEDLDSQYRREMQLMQDTVIEPLQKKIEYAIAEVAREKHMDFVFKSYQLAFATTSADITAQVIARLKQMESSPDWADGSTTVASVTTKNPTQAATTPASAATPSRAASSRPVDRQRD